MIKLLIKNEEDFIHVEYVGKNPVYSSIDHLVFPIKGSDLMDAIALYYETKKEMEEDNG